MKTQDEVLTEAIALLEKEKGQGDSEVERLQRITSSIEEMRKGLITQSTVDLFHKLREESLSGIEVSHVISNVFDRPLNETDIEIDEMLSAEAQIYLGIAQEFTRITCLKPST